MMMRINRRRRCLGTVLLIAALTSTPAVAHAQTDTSPSTPASSTLTPPPLTADITATTAYTNAAAKLDPALVSTFEQILLTSANQQSQAYETQDVSLIASTSTSDYQQWLSQILRQSMDIGISGAHLDALRWSDIALTGPTTASISDRENWTMRYANGRTSAQESRWIYGLVLDSDGTWRIGSATPAIPAD